MELRVEPNGYKWRSAETKDLTVYYKDENGNPHSYHADFLLNEKSLIEIKPVDLMNTPTNICKKEFALEFCKNNAYEYITVDIKSIDYDELIVLYDQKIIKFTERYKNKLEKMKCKLEKKER